MEGAEGEVDYIWLFFLSRGSILDGKKIKNGMKRGPVFAHKINDVGYFLLSFNFAPQPCFPIGCPECSAKLK